MKTYNACKKEVAEKHRLGTTLVTGHTSKYYEEAAFLHAREQAIAFADWKARNGIKQDGLQGDKLLWMKYVDASYVRLGTTEELFELFLAQYKPTV